MYNILLISIQFIGLAIITILIGAIITLFVIYYNKNKEGIIKIADEEKINPEVKQPTDQEQTFKQIVIGDDNSKTNKLSSIHLLSKRVYIVSSGNKIEEGNYKILSPDTLLITVNDSESVCHIGDEIMLNTKDNISASEDCELKKLCN